MTAFTRITGDSVSTHRPLRIAVLLGGTSAEREISLESGASVLAALQGLGHLVQPIDPAEVDCLGRDWSDSDLAFIALHGTFGEDGIIQAILERAGLPFTGSGSAASRLAFSKSAAKVAFLGRGLSTPRHRLISCSDSLYRCMNLAQGFGFPLVIKPDRQGSSLGVSVVRHPCELEFALHRCFELDELGLMEEAILGEEWTVAVMDGVALPPIRISPRTGFFDFRAKYEDDSTSYEIHDVEASPCTVSLARAAIDACQAIGAVGMARVDFRVASDGTPYVLEVNTSPGMTSHSLVPKAAAHLGWDFTTLCRHMIHSALSRSEHQETTIRTAAVEPLRKAV